MICMTWSASQRCIIAAYIAQATIRVKRTTATKKFPRTGS
jgi:hypothetical protein